VKLSEASGYLGEAPEKGVEWRSARAWYQGPRAIRSMHYDNIRPHLDMLKDKVRTEAYRDAIVQVVRPGDRVLDFGCGTGVLSIFAERAGADHVYALDRSSMLRAARLIFEENGCKRIEPVFGQGELVELPSPVDVIVSEWMGHFLFAERMLEPLLRLRDRFLRPGGRMIPSQCSLHAALVVAPSYFEDLSFLCTRPYGIDFAAIGDWPMSDVQLLRMRPDDLLPETTCLGRLDLATVTETPRLLSSSITSGVDATVYGVCGWFEAQLAPDVCLSTSPFTAPTHWLHFYFPFHRPLDVRAGEPVSIEIQIIPQLQQNGYAWRVTNENGARHGESLESSSQSPGPQVTPIAGVGRSP
jgi:type I protein arginine methyltransferase